jgi:hypothetical protein
MNYQSKNGNSSMPEMGEQQGGMGDNNMTTPPDKPDGENNSSNQGNSEVPDKPDGEDNNGNEPNMPNGDMNSNGMGEMPTNNSNISISYYIIYGIEALIISIIIIYLIMSNFNKKTLKETLSNNDKKLICVLSILILTGVLTYTDTIISKKLNNNSNMQSMDNNPNNNTNSNITYSAVKEITEDETVESKYFTSENADENAISVSGNVNATLDGITVEKTGDSDGGDNTSFYGINSAIIAKNGANLVIKNATITTNATGANGVFSYGGSATTTNSTTDGTTITISDSTITTEKDNSGGIMTTGGGKTIASNLLISTSGISSAAIRSDRGGGTVEVDGGTYTTMGQGSPTIYSTADITVSNAKLVAKKSEGIVIEGKNKVSINKCTLSDTNSELNGKSTTYKNIFLYQSMSGDADTGTSEFSATDSDIITNNGDSFYVTNTTATINLTNNRLYNYDSTGNFLRVQADSWGNTGSNGGDVTLNLTNQTVEGTIVIDKISTLEMNMKSSSTFTGVINKDKTAKSITLNLSSDSKIKLTADSYITKLNNDDSSNSNIDFNGYKLYVNGKAIN